MWFTASLLFKCVDALQPGKELRWEDRLVLLSAESAEEAQAIAETMGQKAALDSSDHDDDNVLVIFETVESVWELEGGMLESGTELFSRFLRPRAAHSLLQGRGQRVTPSVNGRW